MSIYPVRLSEWFPKSDENHETMKLMVEVIGENEGCLYCKKKHVHWQEAWGHHSLPYGYGNIWCRKKCFKNFLEKKLEVK